MPAFTYQQLTRLWLRLHPRSGVSG